MTTGWRYFILIYTFLVAVIKRYNYRAASSERVLHKCRFSNSVITLGSYSTVTPINSFTSHTLPKSYISSAFPTHFFSSLQFFVKSSRLLVVNWNKLSCEEGEIKKTLNLWRKTATIAPFQFKCSRLKWAVLRLWFTFGFFSFFCSLRELFSFLMRVTLPFNLLSSDRYEIIIEIIALNAQGLQINAILLRRFLFNPLIASGNLQYALSLRIRLLVNLKKAVVLCE